MDHPQKHEKIRLVEINSYLTCYLCKGYLIDATTISECLHSFCRSCIIKFLQENCYCPVCEVIINKAKPCLKLDKTLQDIVYKLVPGLFVNEMFRRKEFYQNRPALAPKVSPEERGEDTERTIFNPQDAISLSIEYISDDSAPGAIPSLSSSTKNGSTPEEVNDNPMKRYLQCPGMCRIEVLKKFVRNKYNVDTNLFHIDILYKRVPLPDHYTLIDIGYIYSWKRNEPMKFFFRITDINKVAERFDYFDGRVSPEVVQKPTRLKQEKASKEKKKEATSQVKKEEVRPVKQEAVVKNEVSVKCEEKKEEVKCLEPVKEEAVNKGEVILKPEMTEEIKNKIKSEKGDGKNSVYTNITLNRADNVEIITKIQKVSNKEGQPIGLNIINHTVKKANKVQNGNKTVSDAKVVPSSSNDNNEKPETKTEQDAKDKEKEEIEKSNFLKSIELTAKSTLPIEEKKKEILKVPTPPPAPSSSQKRKNSSPMKNEKCAEKKPKIEKKPMKIIIQPKKQTDLQALIDNCKIPASLSITLNESGDTGARTPPSIPPVKNFIEILKLPDKDPNKNKDKPSDKTSTPVVKDKNRNIPTFQKIFEESITNKKPVDTSTPIKVEVKRKILEIASQLQKKSKMELEKQKEESLNKVAIPRLATQRTLKPPNKHDYSQNRSQNSANLHSPSLGLNYTVSVAQNKSNGEVKPSDTKPRTSPSTSKPKSTTNGTSSKNLSPNQLLEKYNIQNLAQLTASFNFNSASYGALQHAMLLKQMEHHSWLNQGPLLQYEKYLQSLSAQSKLMGNIKEN